MIVKNAELETVCGITSKLPENGQIEVAFAGKSNVGKSSLINGLMNRKSLARTSSAPGKTQTINFYAVTGRRETKKEALSRGPSGLWLCQSFAERKAEMGQDDRRLSA